MELIYYLADESDNLLHGTAIYVPKSPETRCQGDRYHPRGAFALHSVAPYRPNTAFLFVKSERSFHGVEPVREPAAERWVLVHTLHRWL